MLTAVAIFLGAILIFIILHRNQEPEFSGKKKSIAVLPFMNTDSLRENDYISEGLTSEIVHRLSGISGLRVVLINPGGNSHFSPLQVSRDLKVASFLRGKIKKTGDAFSIQVDLVNTGTGATFWSKTFQSNLNELFAFQNELAQVVTEELHMEITSEEENRLHSRPTQNLEAYDQYLKGIYFWNKRDPASLRKGIEFFNEAILLDSNYAKAWSGLADCYSALGYGSHDAPSFDFLKAERAARKALRLDSSLAEPHTSLGYIEFYYYWNWVDAEKEFLTAIRMNPDYPLAHDAYVYFLTARERYAEAGVQIEKAYSLDPASAFIQTDQGFALYYAGHYDRAISVLKEVLVRYPAFPLACLWLGRSYQEKKNYPEAIHAYQMALKKDSAWPVAQAAIGFIYGETGHQVEAEKRLKQMTELMDRRYVTPYGMALLYAGMKNKDKTFFWLNRAYAERANWLVWLKQDPRWAYIKNDPRYIALQKKIGIIQETVPLSKD